MKWEWKGLFVVGLLSLGGVKASRVDASEPRAPLSPYLETSPDYLGVHHQLIREDKGSGLDLFLDVWTPSAAGDYPVFLFLTGLNGVAPPLAYTQTFAKMAERGMIVIAPYVGLVGPGSAGRVSLQFIQSIYWLKRHLPEELRKGGLGSQVNAKWDQLLASGHSSSVKAMMDFYRSYKVHVAGLVLIDPVNSYPFEGGAGTVPQDEYFDDGIPVLILASGLGRKPGRDLGQLWPPCAPEGVSGTYFFDHFAGPKYYMEALEYGHADMLEGFFLKALQATQFCDSAKDKDPQRYRTWLAGAIASFTHTVIEHNEDYRRYLEDPAAIPAITRVMVVP